MNAVLRYAKAHVALVGGLATWAVATFPGTQAAHVAAAVLAVLTAFGVYVVPNAKKRVTPRKRAARSAGHVDVGYLLAVVVAVILLVVLVRVLFGTFGR